MCSINGVGERLVLNCGCHGSQKLPLTYNGKNGVSTFSQSFLVGSLPNLQVSKKGVKSEMSSNSSWIGSFILVLRALEGGLNFQRGVPIPAGLDHSLQCYTPLRTGKICHRL